MPDQECADLEQQFGPLYPHSDYKRGERIRFSSFDGTIKSGTIVWVQEPGTTANRYHLRAMYIIEPDDPAGTMGFEFVPLGDVQSDE